jgi:hypothetical protein
MPITLMEIARNAACNAVVVLVGSAGRIQLLNSSNVTLVNIYLANPAFSTAAVGVATAQGLPLVGVAGTAGTLAKYWILDAAADLKWQGTIGIAGSGADMIVDSTSIALGQAISITSWTHTQPA